MHEWRLVLEFLRGPVIRCKIEGFMAIQYKDYYKALGVARDASQDQIRRAYRKLARKYHPDVARDEPGAEERFKEINEAHEVLKDPEKRRKYDTLGSGVEGGEFRPSRGWESEGWEEADRMPGGFGFNVGGTGFSDFFEAFFGSRQAGGDPFAGPFGEAGPGMGGFRRTAQPRAGADLETDIMVTLEEAIHGSTRQVSVRRDGGVTEKYQVRIPPGVRQGQRIRLAGKGEAGVAGGPSGNLYLRVRLSEHPFFRVKEGDIYYDLPLAPWEAVLGTRVEVPTPSGKAALKIPPGTLTGKKFRLRHQGLLKEGGARGDMYVVVQIQVPSEVSLEEKDLWEKLARTSSFEPRR